MADLFEPLVSFNASIAAIIIYMKRKTKLISAKKFTLKKKKLKKWKQENRSLHLSTLEEKTVTVAEVEEGY